MFIQGGRGTGMRNYALPPVQRPSTVSRRTMTISVLYFLGFRAAALDLHQSRPAKFAYRQVRNEFEYHNTVFAGSVPI
jgi:hypothetical protein